MRFSFEICQFLYFFSTIGSLQSWYSIFHAKTQPLSRRAMYIVLKFHVKSFFWVLCEEDPLNLDAFNFDPNMDR